MSNKNSLLLELLKTNTPSGREDIGCQTFQTLCDIPNAAVVKDKVGNLALGIGNLEEPTTKILISAHIDEIGLRVQFIDDNGFIFVTKNGGVDLKTCLGAKVNIIHDTIITTGVIGKAPIHVERRNDSEGKKIEITDIKIDCGFNNKEEALKYVAIGDCIVFKQTPEFLANGRVVSKGLDDKAGIYVVMRVLQELKEKNLKKVAVYGACCTQEETTWNGAASLVKMINPDISLDYDVTFATDDGHVEAKEWGDVKLGNGGCIVHSPDCNHELVSKLKDVAKTCNIPTQEFSLSGSMTNTSPLKQFGFNVQTALLSIPLRNMHTQVEVCDIHDLESLVALTVETILSIELKED